jgi:hypothetical protein
MITQSHQGRDRVRQRQAALGSIFRPRGRTPRAVTPVVIGTGVGARRKLRAVAQRGEDESRRAHQSEEVHPGDHEHELGAA